MASPPQTLIERLKFIGPGIVFAAFSVGSGELLLTPRSGALYGYTLIWVPVIALIYKCCFSIVMSRQTVSESRDIFFAFSDLPGPRNWATYFVFFLYILEMIGHGGIMLLAGTAVYAFFGVKMQIAGTFTVLLIATLLWSGSYTFVENFIKVMACVLITGVAYNLRFVELPLDQVAQGLVPHIPHTKDGLLTVMGLLGWIASGTGTLLYSSWVMEKMDTTTAPDKSVYTQWMKTVRIDCVLSYVFIGAVSFAFLILGVYVLGGQTGFRSGRETMMALSEMLAKFPYGRQVFLVTAYFTLLNTVLCGVDGRGRAFYSLVRIIRGDGVNQKLIYRATVILYCSIMLIVCWSGEPVRVVTIIAACSGVGFGIFGFMLLYLNRGLPDYARSGRVLTTIILLGSTLFLGLAFVQSYRNLLSVFGG